MAAITEAERLGTILSVWAHPDDETYLSAGLMAAAVRAGNRVVCVTATRGEAGSLDQERWPPETIAAVRESELLEALTLLGVTEHYWLDYVDGTCSGVRIEDGTEAVRWILELVAPDSVLTFGPEGMTGHPDHKAVHHWTTEAFRLAGTSKAALYYATVTPEWAREFVPLAEPFSIYYEPDTPPQTPAHDLAIDYHLPPDIHEAKWRAIVAQRSQSEGLIQAFGRDVFERLINTETYRAADV
jgi:LmbE family N-acetylglucosaminyl deacetylase